VNGQKLAEVRDSDFASGDAGLIAAAMTLPVSISASITSSSTSHEGLPRYIGCRLNQAEIEQYARQIETAGIVWSPSFRSRSRNRQYLCGHQRAVSDSRQKIRLIARSGGAEILPQAVWRH